MGRGVSSLLFRLVLLVLAFILVISIGILQSDGGNTTTIPSDIDRRSRTSTTAKSQQQVKVLGKGKSSHVADLNYMSKRRVPNGPDPIHNRRAGNSGRPPGRA